MSVAVYPASVAFDSPGITGSVPIRGLPGEKMYREILKNLPLPCYAVDEEGFLVFYNEEAARLWGRRPEIGKKEQWSGAFRLFTSEGKELPPSLCAVACALRERRSIHGVEMIVERPDGSRRIVVDHPDPLFDTDGNCLGVVSVQIDVSQQRETQEALRQSEALFRDMADHAPVMVWVTDADGRCRFLSETWYEFTGQTEETGLGSGWLSAIHPEDREATLVPCAAAKARREGYRLEYRLLHASGEYRRVLVVANPRFGPKEEFLGYIGSVLDVTAQRKADEWAQNAAQRLRLATEARALGTWDYFPTSGSLIWDNRCKELFGLPAEAAVDYEVFLAGLHPDDRERTDATVKLALDPSGDGAMDVEYRTIGIADRIERWVHANGRVFFEDGVAKRFVGTVQDITDRKKADEAVQRLAAIVETSEDAIISKDLNGIIMSWNGGAERLFGYRAEEVVGKPITILIPSDRRDEEGGILQRIRQGQRVEHYETVRQCKNGTHIEVSLTISPLRDRTGMIIGASKIARDISERKLTERELERAKEAAEAASRSKDRFLAVLSHELRTPLTPVLMTAALRERDPDLPQSLRADMAMIRRNVELETKLIDDLLDLSRITSGKLSLRLESLDLNAAVEQVCDICHSQIQEKGIQLFVVLDATVEMVTADSSRLQQILWNVLKNAAKFTPQGGTIRVTTSRVGAGRMQVQVEDSGAGISAQMLPKIFDAFEQGDARVTRQFGGLGLGLAISKALVELHHGSIRVESPGIGAGCTVTIEMPAAASHKEPSSAVGAFKAGNSEQPLRLLIVEDHADTALLLKRLLETSGYTVKTAGGVAEALEAAAREPFDVLVSDLGLPDGTGCELMRQLRERQPLRGIAMSGYGMEEDVRQSLEAGFSEHLVKPVDISTLERTILSLASQDAFRPRTPG
ncbi:MAG TPA: PAS domain S-box protein [Terrimicrobiaceae bacterium]